MVPREPGANASAEREGLDVSLRVDHVHVDVTFPCFTESFALPGNHVAMLIWEEELSCCFAQKSAEFPIVSPMSVIWSVMCMSMSRWVKVAEEARAVALRAGGADRRDAEELVAMNLCHRLCRATWLRVRAG